VAFGDDTCSTTTSSTSATEFVEETLGATIMDLRTAARMCSHEHDANRFVNTAPGNAHASHRRWRPSVGVDLDAAGWECGVPAADRRL
jgi:hypothetical protein